MKTTPETARRDSAPVTGANGHASPSERPNSQSPEWIEQEYARYREVASYVYGRLKKRDEQPDALQAAIIAGFIYLKRR